MYQGSYNNADICVQNLLSKNSLPSLQVINNAPNQPQWHEGYKLLRHLGKLEFNEMNNKIKMEQEQEEIAKNANKKADLSKLAQKYVRIKRLKTEQSEDNQQQKSYILTNQQVYDIQNQGFISFNEKKEEIVQEEEGKENQIKEEEQQQQKLLVDTNSAIKELEQMIKADGLVKKLQNSYKEGLSQIELEGRRKQQEKIVNSMKQNIVNLDDFIKYSIEILKQQSLYTDMVPYSETLKQEENWELLHPYFYFQEKLFIDAIENKHISWKNANLEQAFQLLFKIIQIQKPVVDFILKIIFDYLQNNPEVFEQNSTLQDAMEHTVTFLNENEKFKSVCLSSLLKINHKLFYKNLNLKYQYDQYSHLFKDSLQDKMNIIQDEKRDKREKSNCLDLAFSFCALNRSFVQEILENYLNFPEFIQVQTLKNLNQNEQRFLVSVIKKMSFDRFSEMTSLYQDKIQKMLQRIEENSENSTEKKENLLLISQCLLQGLFRTNQEQDCQENKEIVFALIGFHVSFLACDFGIIKEIQGLIVEETLLEGVGIELLQDFEKIKLMEGCLFPDGVNYLGMVFKILLKRNAKFLQKDKLVNLIYFLENLEKDQFIRCIGQFLDEFAVENENSQKIPDVVIASIIKGQKKYRDENEFSNLIVKVINLQQWKTIDNQLNGIKIYFNQLKQNKERILEQIEEPLKTELKEKLRQQAQRK